jgi:hypothetical protein
MALLKVVGVAILSHTLLLLFFPMPVSAKVLNAMPEHIPSTSNILVIFFIGVNFSIQIY